MIPSTAYGMCALAGPPIALRAGGHDAIHGCSMPPLSFLPVSHPFTHSHTLVMRANGYWRCIGVVPRICPFARAD